MNFSDLFMPVTRAALYEKKINESRVAAENEIYYIALGGAVFSFGEKTVKPGAGGFVFLPAGASYTLRCDYARMVGLSFPGTPGAPFDEPFSLPDLSSFEENFLSLCDIFLSETATSGALLSVGLAEILIRVYEEVDEGALPARLVRSLDEYIRDNAESDVSNTEIAAVFGYHPFYISQMFKAKMGVTLRQYVTAYRFRLARAMLKNTDKSVGEIAAASGFRDASYFTKSFKATFGITPKEYRKAD